MKDRLRLGKTQDDEASMSQAAVVKKVEGTMHEGSDLTDEKNLELVCSGTEEDALASAPKQELETDQVYASKDEECSGGSIVVERNVAEATNSRRKTTRMDGGDEHEDGTEGKKLNDEVEDVKIHAVGRFLRSRFFTKTESENQGDRGQNKSVVVGKRTKPSNGSEKKRVGVEKGEIGHSDREGSDQPDNEVRKNLNCKVRRSPKVQKSDGFEKECTDVEKEESDQADNGARQKLKGKRGRPSKAQKTCKERDEVEKEDNQSADKERKNLKRKRRRPSKAQKTHKERDEVEKEENQFTDKGRQNLKRRRGRPPGAQKRQKFEKKRAEVERVDKDQPAGEEIDESHGKFRKKLKTKRGRPPKMNRDGECMMRTKVRETNLRRSMNDNEGNNNSLFGKKFHGEKSNLKKLVPNKKIKFDENVGGKTKQKARVMWQRSERQAVRDKIVELLLGAGWTIEYRPRNGTIYNDAVYVNPEGRTHWSVTLAYRVLKKHYEDNGGDLQTSKTGFKFTPLPEEELNKLMKVMSKERCDKNKKRKKRTEEGKVGQTDERVTKKKKLKQALNKGELRAASLGIKMFRGRTKHKALLFEKEDLHRTSEKGTAVSARKRLETRDRKQCALMVRKSKENSESDSDGYVLYNGKRTVLTWMIDLGTVAPDTKVQCFKRRKTRAALKGRITTDGIQCDCCSETFTTTEFETHAGSKSCHPLENIYLETGSSLLQCQLESWLKQDESARKGFHFVDVDGEDPNDDTCGICGDGGDLICCDGCPSTFHQSCLEIKEVPSGVWHCIYCSCKFCGMVSQNMRQRDDIDTTEKPAILTCCLCNEKYHQSCVLAKDAVNDDPGSPSFCGKKCQELYERLQRFFGVKHELEGGFSWMLIRRFDVGSNISLSGIPRKVECNSKAAVALSIMDECFLPMVDNRSGVNLIRNIVYNFGSNFNRLNYIGFLTAILERGDEVICAASIRIHGKHLAEMPFIGTREIYRRQGMCRRLLSGIETALASLNVEKLVIPAIPELRETWTSVFGFEPLEGSIRQKMRNVNMMVFPGVDMLQKPLLKHQFAEESVISPRGLKSTKFMEHRTMNEMRNISDERCSSKFENLKDSEGTTVAYDGDPAGSLLNGGLNDTSDIASDDTYLLICATNTKCNDQSGVIADNMGTAKRTIVNPCISISLCNPNEQGGKVNEHQNTVSVSIVPPPNNAMQGLDLQLNRDNVPELENKSCIATHDGSEPADCGGELLCSSREVTETVPCEVEIGVPNVKDNCNSLVVGSMCTPAEIISTERQDLAELRIEVSDKNDVHHENKTSNTSSALVRSASLKARQREDAVNSFCSVLSTDHDISSSYQSNWPDPDCDPSHVTASDVTAEHNLQACSSNGLYMSREITSDACEVNVDDVHDLKAVSATAQTDSLSLAGDLVSDRPVMNAKSSKQPDPDSSKQPGCDSSKRPDPDSSMQPDPDSSKQPGPDSKADNPSVMQCNFESLSNSSPGPVVTLLCASAGGDSRAPEAIILSNQAS